MAVNAPPILLIHGFPFDHTMWRHQVAELSHWRCLAPDLRLPAGGDYSMASYASYLIDLLDSLRIHEAVICGLSMGGYIGFELLRSYPKRVRAAILCDTKATADTEPAKMGRDAMAALAKERGAVAIAEKLLPNVLSPATFENRPDVVEEVRAMILRQPVDQIVGALRALRDRPDSTPLLETIRAPVLVVAGADDQITPAAGMEEMARALPRADFELIPEAGHLAPLEQPLAVNVAIAGFLSKLG
jgi:pimeloyl-ACP methyl ester carboxylesterase